MLYRESPTLRATFKLMYQISAYTFLQNIAKTFALKIRFIIHLIWSVWISSRGCCLGDEKRLFEDIFLTPSHLGWQQKKGNIFLYKGIVLAPLTVHLNIVHSEVCFTEFKCIYLQGHLFHVVAQKIQWWNTNLWFGQF